MAYTESEKSTGLDTLTSAELATGDLFIVGDVSDSGRAKGSTLSNVVSKVVTEIISTEGGLVNTVTGLNTNNTDPTNPVIQISVDGVTITGAGTPASPLVAVLGGSGGNGTGDGKPKSYQMRHLMEQVTSSAAIAGIDGYTDTEFYAITVADQSGAPITSYLLVEAPGLQRTVINTSLTDADYNRIKGYVVLGDYIYVLTHNTTSGVATRLYRYTLANLAAAPTLMTIAGQAFGTNEFGMTSNGTHFFFTRDAGGTANAYEIAKYSLSGTTLTYVSTTTLAGTPTVNGFAVLSDITYLVTTDAGSATTLTTYDSSGTLLTTTAGYNDAYIPLTNFTGTIYVGLVSDLANTGYAEFVKLNFDGEPIDGNVVTTYQSIPVGYLASSSNLAMSTNTHMYVGLVNIPNGITVSSISIQVNTVTVAGTLDLTVYSENGQRVLIAVTTASISATGVVTTAVSAVALPAGNYYFAINTNTTASLQVQMLNISNLSLQNAVTSEPRYAGRVTITAGTPPTTFNPTSDPTANIRVPLFRLDS